MHRGKSLFKMTMILIKIVFSGDDYKKDMQSQQKSYFTTFVSKISWNFGRLRNIRSVNLIAIDSR